jgi:hypothetical protein
MNFWFCLQESHPQKFTNVNFFCKAGGDEVKSKKEIALVNLVPRSITGTPVELTYFTGFQDGQPHKFIKYQSSIHPGF